MSLIERIVCFCCRHALAVIGLCALLGIASALYTQQHFAMNTDSEQLISSHVGWRKREARFDREFPQQNNLIAVVIDGQTPELAEAAAAQLSARLKTDRRLFPIVRRPDGGPFFDQNGLLFLSVKDVQQTTDQLFKAQPFLVGLAICVSAAFCTPVAHESTILVMGPGRYQFKHYVQIGSAMAFLTWLIATLLTPLVWPFGK